MIDRFVVMQLPPAPSNPTLAPFFSRLASPTSTALPLDVHDQRLAASAEVIPAATQRSDFDSPLKSVFWEQLSFYLRISCFPSLFLFSEAVVFMSSFLSFFLELSAFCFICNTQLSSLHISARSRTLCPSPGAPKTAELSRGFNLCSRSQQAGVPFVARSVPSFKRSKLFCTPRARKTCFQIVESVHIHARTSREVTVFLKDVRAHTCSHAHEPTKRCQAPFGS